VTAGYSTLAAQILLVEKE